MTLSRLIARLSVLLLIFGFVAAASALPAAAQSVGDEQYSDPFENSGGGESTGGSSKGSGSKAPAPAPTVAPAPAPAQAPAPLAPSVSELPRTGTDLRPLAAVGLLLLASGVLLLRWSSTARR